MSLLRVEGLTVSLPTAQGRIEVLRAIDLDVARGERLGLVGESGCGKSMLASAIIGLLPEGAHTAGGILLNDTDLLRLNERAWCAVRGRRIGMVFQEPMTALNPVQTIGQQVAEAPRLHFKLSPRQARVRAQDLLKRVGLAPDDVPMDRYPHQLSGGQRQRVGLAIALSCGPDVLLADEPTTALDVTVEAEMLALISRIVREESMALILISHDLGVIARTTEQAAVMYAGRIVERAPSAALFATPRHPYTAGLCAAMPRLRVKHLLAGEADADTPLSTIPGTVPPPHARPVGCNFAPRCPRVRDDCRRAPPPLAPAFGQGGRSAACYHPHTAHAG